MKEIGGYIELDRYLGREYHEEALSLNCGRNGLAYLLKAKKIKRVYLPYFLCSSVANTCRKYGTEVIYYHVDETLRPVFDKDISEDEIFYIVNYYGQLSDDEIEDFKKRFGNVVLDNAQAFFQMPPENVDAIYTCRKYFGVADGAYLYTSSKSDEEYETDVSYDRMKFILGRFEKGANGFYADYVSNNKLFRDEPIKKMSLLTHNLMRGIDYDRVKKIREDNFTALHDSLGHLNKLSIKTPPGPFMYPLYIDGGAELRKKLQDEKIYIPTLWPDVFDVCSESDLEYDMAKNILPLPIDQRYNKETMEYIVTALRKGRYMDNV